MEIAETSSRLTRWRLRLGAFSFDIDYKKKYFNIQPNKLSRLKFLVRTTVPTNEDISVYPHNTTLTQEQVVKGSDSDVSDHLPLARNDLQDPPLVPVTIGEMLQEQQADRFCC